jgi:hypothetical protein
MPPREKGTENERVEVLDAEDSGESIELFAGRPAAGQGSDGTERNAAGDGHPRRAGENRRQRRGSDARLRNRSRRARLEHPAVDDLAARLADCRHRRRLAHRAAVLAGRDALVHDEASSPVARRHDASGADGERDREGEDTAEHQRKDTAATIN